MHDVAAVARAVGSDQPPERHRPQRAGGAAARQRSSYPLLQDADARERADRDAEHHNGHGHAEEERGCRSDDERNDPGNEQRTADALPCRRAPWEQRAYAHQQDECEHEWAVHAIEERLPHGDGATRRQFRNERKYNAPQRDERDTQEEQVVHEEGGLTRERRFERRWAAQDGHAVEEECERCDRDHAEEGEEHPAQRRRSKRVHRRHRPAPVDEDTERAQGEADVDECDVPHAEHAPALLDHDGVDEGGERQPGHERGVLNGVPCPVAAPTEDRVRPPGAEQQTDSEQHPRGESPDATGVHPVVVDASAQERCDSQRERHRYGDEAGHDERRVREHAGVREQRIDALPVRRSPFQCVERVREEEEHHQEEQQDEHEHAVGVRAERAQPLRSEGHGKRRHAAQRECDVQQRARVARVESNPGVDAWHRKVAVLRHVTDAEIVLQERVNERTHRYRQRERGQIVRTLGADNGGNIAPLRADE